jgi:predicted DNA-binding helix-hairpin-helix protein
VARTLRITHAFRGYIHLKTIPDADAGLLAEAGRYADRLSINIEMPTERGLESLAPEKNGHAIRGTMAKLRLKIEAAAEDAKAPRFAPAGQSTQMIVGADDADDRAILTTSASLYGSYRLKRVYYSAFSPIPDASRKLPPQAPPLMREHRLYQADWLLRFYGFAVDEIVGRDGHLPLDMDPKLAFALRHRERFPVDVNRAGRRDLLRVPGLGKTAVERIIAARRHCLIRASDLKRLNVPIRRVLPFLVTADHRPRRLDEASLRARLLPPRQVALGL